LSKKVGEKLGPSKLKWEKSETQICVSKVQQLVGEGKRSSQTLQYPKRIKQWGKWKTEARLGREMQEPLQERKERRGHKLVNE